jgi:hypothetical protein
MKNRKFALLALVPVAVLFMGAEDACFNKSVQSVSGTKMATVGKVDTNTKGLTTEQQNITDRIKMDNKVGAIKHLYVVSAYSGQVIIYSTVRGKVTSSGKRLTPDKVDGGNSFTFDIGSSTFYTNQVLGEDGTYGSSIEYLYWWDARGVYHQHYVTGGQIVHVSDQPLAVKGIVINMEVTQKPTAEQ